MSLIGNKHRKDDPVLYAIVKNLRSPLNQFKYALKHVLDQKSIRAFVKARDNLTRKNSLLYHKLRLKAYGKDVWHFVVLKTHRSMALDGCHCEAHIKVNTTPFCSCSSNFGGQVWPTN